MKQGSDGLHERMAMRMIGQAGLALLLMSYPWLVPGLQQWFVFGLPAVLVYFFVIWVLLIALAARLRTDV